MTTPAKLNEFNHAEHRRGCWISSSGHSSKAALWTGPSRWPKGPKERWWPSTVRGGAPTLEHREFTSPKPGDPSPDFPQPAQAGLQPQNRYPRQTPQRRLAGGLPSQSPACLRCGCLGLLRQGCIAAALDSMITCIRNSYGIGSCESPNEARLLSPSH